LATNVPASATMQIAAKRMVQRAWDPVAKQRWATRGIVNASSVPTQFA
jgi:hypothetical protein